MIAITPQSVKRPEEILVKRPEEILTRLAPGDHENKELLTQLGLTNPFCTVEYARAMQTLGREACVVGLRLEPIQDNATLAFVKKGLLSVELEFVSLPRVAQDPSFWEVVDQLCKRCGVTDIIAGSFGSVSFELPTLHGELSRQTRFEYVLQLEGGSDSRSHLSATHRQNVKKAQKAGATIRRTRDNMEWLSAHATLMTQSAQRRIARGESVSMTADTTTCRALMESGAAELFQAVLGPNVLSSVLVLLSPRSAYSQSVGNSPEGMKRGASHFVNYEITRILAEEGRVTFNLGGAPEGSSLAAFKLAFGAETLVLPAATCYVGPVWKRRVRSAVRLLRSGLFRVSR